MRAIKSLTRLNMYYKRSYINKKNMGELGMNEVVKKIGSEFARVVFFGALLGGSLVYGEKSAKDNAVEDEYTFHGLEENCQEQYERNLGCYVSTDKGMLVMGYNGDEGS